MISDHITIEHWISYFTGNCSDMETAILYAHSSGCRQCRDILDYGKSLRRSLSATRTAYHTENSAYQAAAASGDAPRKEKRAGSLSVQLSSDSQCFLLDTLEAKGYATMYAMNLEADGKVLRDFGDLLIMELRDSLVHLQFQDKIRAFTRIYSDSATGLWLDMQETTDLQVVPGDKLTLEILFLG